MLEWLEGVEPESTSSQPLNELAVEARVFCWRSPHMRGLPSLNRLFSLYFCGCCVRPYPRLLQHRTLLLCSHCCTFHGITALYCVILVVVWHLYKTVLRLSAAEMFRRALFCERSWCWWITFCLCTWNSEIPPCFNETAMAILVNPDNMVCLPSNWKWRFSLCW